MKIAHVNYIPFDNQVGVNKKILSQAKAAKEKKLNIDFFILNSFEEKEKDNLILKKIKEPTYKKRLFRYDLINKYIDFSYYDFIIIRYSGMDFSSFKLFQRYGEKIITEHHTNELAEILTSGTFSSKIRFFIEKYRAPNILKNVKGLISVTNEIKNFELQRIGEHLPATVISNGIDVNDVSFTKFKKFNEKELNIIFVASFFAPWHGLEKLLKGLLDYKGKVKIILHLVGGIFEKQKLMISNINKSKKNVEVKIYGKLYGKELDNIFSLSTIAISTIAISTIAMSTAKMTEACPLKTREYIARGIPFVYGYKDVDLLGNEEFSMKIDENKEINFEKIIEFAKRVSSIANVSQQMREFALSKLDWKVKIKQMYGFIKSLNV